jgi:release factor glutamine methyltransferase
LFDTDDVATRRAAVPTLFDATQQQPVVSIRPQADPPPGVPLPRARGVDPDTVTLLRAAGCAYAEDEARVLTEAARSTDELRSLIDRRAGGEPLEYVVGWAEFCGLRIPVSGGVFVPRRRSEFLAECAVNVVNATKTRAGEHSGRVKVLDVCCGSGAIGLAVAISAGDVELLAADDSPPAVDCARENLAPVGGRVYLGDLFVPIPRCELHSMDVIVANPPYVPTDEIQRLPSEARLYEPRSTLDGGQDGMDVQRRLLASASDWLRAPGLVLIETSSDMADETALIARDDGFTVEIRRSSELDAAVVVATRWP